MRATKNKRLEEERIKQTGTLSNEAAEKPKKKGKKKK